MPYQPLPTRGSACRLAVSLAGAACLTGCLAAYLDPAPTLRDIGYGAGEDAEGGRLARAPFSPPSSPPPGLVPRFLDHLGRRLADLDRAAAPSVLTDDRGSVGRPFSDTLPEASPAGLFGDETRDVVAERALGEFRRVTRRSFRDALRQERAYQQLRAWLPVSVGDDETFGSFSERVLDAPVRGLPPAAWGPPSLEDPAFVVPDVLDMDGSVSVGVRPEIEIVWMGLYSFSWGPRDDKRVHRIEYDFGPVGLGAEYRVREGVAVLAGAGLQVSLGSLSSLSFTAAEVLHGAAPDRPWTYLAELYVRF